jgi:hypothetical protein
VTAVALGPKGKVVEIPDEMLQQFDSGQLNRSGLIDYAMSTQQGRASDFGLQETKPDMRGAMNAAMVGAGRQLDDLKSNAIQAMDQMAGNPAGAEDQKYKQAEIARLAAPIKEQYPKSSFAGEMLPGFAVPGGLPTQMAVGAATGALQGDTTSERLTGAGMGAGGAYIGQKAGDALSQRFVPMAQRALGNRLGGARSTLAREGIPLTLGQRGSPLGRLVDTLKSTLMQKQPLHLQQVTALNRAAAEALGEKADDLGKPVLNRAATRIGNVYEKVATQVGTIPISPQVSNRFVQIDDMMKTVPEPSKVTGAIAMVQEQLTNPTKEFTGEAYNAMRQRLGAISRQLWNGGNGLEAEVVDELIDTIDEALAQAAPKFAKELDEVRPQWQFLKALRRGSAIDDLGNINPRAMNAAMESVYKGFDIGKMPSGSAGRFGQTLDAFNQVIRPFKSSGTAERMATMSVPVLAGLGVTGVMGPQAGLGTLGALAAALSGGGAGAQAGGNLGREGTLKLAELLRQMQQQQQQQAQ